MCSPSLGTILVCESSRYGCVHEVMWLCWVVTREPARYEDTCWTFDDTIRGPCVRADNTTYVCILNLLFWPELSLSSVVLLFAHKLRSSRQIIFM